jgi:hypothetical protein
MVRMAHTNIRGAVLAAIAVGLLAAAPASPVASRYGGPVYLGPPTAGVTAELYHVGGEAGGFSSIRALNAMATEPAVTAEFAKLRGQYGDAAVDAFVKTFDYAINDGWTRAGQKNVTFGAPAMLSDDALGVALVTAGSADDGTFWSGLLLDKLLTNAVHAQVMNDIDGRYGAGADAQFHRIGNQLFYDLAQTLHANAKLAAFH